MKIHEVLRSKGTEVVVIDPTAPVQQLVETMQQHNLGAVVVSPDGQRIDGIVSERDVVRHLATGAEFLTGPVADIMTAVVHTCSAGDSIESLMPVMTDARIRHLPVVDDQQRLSGIISIGDVVKSTVTQLEFERDQLQGYVSS